MVPSQTEHLLSHQGILVVHIVHLTLPLAVTWLTLVIRAGGTVLACHRVDLGIAQTRQLLGRVHIALVLIIALGEDEINLL